VNSEPAQRADGAAAPAPSRGPTATSRRPRVARHALAFAAVTLLAGSCYFAFQPRMKAGHGRGWDGQRYSQMYGDFRNGTRSQVQFPFSARVGLPYLASKLDLPEEQAFLLINLLSGGVASVFVFLALARRVTPWIAWLCALPMCLYLFSPIRFPAYYVFIGDPPATATLAIAAFCEAYELYATGGLVIASGIVFRESNLYLLLAFVAVPLWRSWRRRDASKALRLGSVILAGVAVRFGAQSVYHPHGHQLLSALKWSYVKVSNPIDVLKYFAAMSMTLGPFAYGVLRRRWTAGALQGDAATIPFAALLMSILMAFSGGYDTGRIFFSSYPLYALVLASIVTRYRPYEAIVLALCGGVANRTLQLIPEPLNYYPNEDPTGYWSFFPEYSSAVVALGLLAFWAMVYYALDLAQRNGLEARVRALLRRNNPVAS
jgi:hypothetical protein